MASLQDSETTVAFFLRVQDFFDFLQCYETALWKKTETPKRGERLNKQDCETREIRLKLCEKFLKTIRHPYSAIDATQAFVCSHSKNKRIVQKLTKEDTIKCIFLSYSIL